MHANDSQIRTSQRLVIALYELPFWGSIVLLGIWTFFFSSQPGDISSLLLGILALTFPFSGVVIAIESARGRLRRAIALVGSRGRKELYLHLINAGVLGVVMSAGFGVSLKVGSWAIALSVITGIGLALVGSVWPIAK